MGETQIFVGIKCHLNHDVSHFKSQPPKQAHMSVVQSPSHLLNSGPTNLMQKAALKGVALPMHHQRKTKRKLEALKKKARNVHLPEGSDGRSWGDLVITIEALKRANIDAADWSPHEIYLLGDQYISDSTERHFIAAVSSEELLLNAYRQMCTGQDLTFAVDTSYRYTKEKSGLINANQGNQFEPSWTYHCIWDCFK